MLICKKKSAAAALTNIFFNRIRHLQPAVAFLSPLAFLRTFRAKKFSSLRAHFASVITTHTTTTLRTALLPMQTAGMASGYSSPRAIWSCHATCRQRLHAVRFNEFSPFMALHLFAAAMACVVSGSILVPELFLVS